jgi:hypothetical protein
MKFNDQVKQLLEDFNIAPKYQNAIQGTSQGMTQMLGDSPESGFGSAPNVQMSGKILPDKKKLKKKITPKEKQSKNRSRIQ